MTGGGNGERWRLPGRRRLALILGMFVAGVVVGLVLVAWPHARGGATTTSTAGPASPRLVRLTTTPGAVSDGKQTLAVLQGGRMPHGAARATVLTDENCAPDAQGYSHCLNDVRLADGSVLRLRHNHRMSMVPCLSPGEEVIVEEA
jgi:hypothetical protein